MSLLEGDRDFGGHVTGSALTRRKSLFFLRCPLHPTGDSRQEWSRGVSVSSGRRYNASQRPCVSAYSNVIDGFDAVARIEQIRIFPDESEAQLSKSEAQLSESEAQLSGSATWFRSTSARPPPSSPGRQN